MRRRPWLQRKITRKYTRGTEREKNAGAALHPRALSVDVATWARERATGNGVRRWPHGVPKSHSEKRVPLSKPSVPPVAAPHPVTEQKCRSAVLSSVLSLPHGPWCSPGRSPSGRLPPARLPQQPRPPATSRWVWRHRTCGVVWVSWRGRIYFPGPGRVPREVVTWSV